LKKIITIIFLLFNFILIFSIYLHFNSFAISSPLHYNERISSRINFYYIDLTEDSITVLLKNNTSNDLISSQPISIEFFDGTNWRVIPHRYANSSVADISFSSVLHPQESSSSILYFNDFPSFKRIKRRGYNNYRVRIGLSFFSASHAHFEFTTEFSFD